MFRSYGSFATPKNANNALYQKTQSALITLNILRSSTNNSRDFFQYLVQHAKYAETVAQFFKRIKNPYAYIQLELKNKPELEKNFRELYTALITLDEAKQHIQNLPVCAHDRIKTEYKKEINKNLNQFASYRGFINKVIAFCDYKLQLKQEEDARLLLYKEEAIQKYSRRW